MVLFFQGRCPVTPPDWTLTGASRFVGLQNICPCFLAVHKICGYLKRSPLQEQEETAMNGMKKTALTMTFMALGLFVVSASAEARQTRGQGYHMMGSGMMWRLSEQEQKTAMEVMQKYHGPMMELRKQLFSKDAELNAVMAQDKFDAKKARALGKEISNLQAKLKEHRMEMFIEMREKGVSYYGACMSGDMMGPCMMGGPMGSGMGGRGMMMDGMDGRMMNQEMMEPVPK
jgi:zinc resistance-associated protein